jgi:hypothetical protein
MRMATTLLAFTIIVAIVKHCSQLKIGQGKDR